MKYDEFSDRRNARWMGEPVPMVSEQGVFGMSAPAAPAAPSMGYSDFDPQGLGPAPGFDTGVHNEWNATTRRALGNSLGIVGSMMMPGAMGLALAGSPAPWGLGTMLGVGRRVGNAINDHYVRDFEINESNRVSRPDLVNAILGYGGNANGQGQGGNLTERDIEQMGVW